MIKHLFNLITFLSILLTIPFVSCSDFDTTFIKTGPQKEATLRKKSISPIQNEKITRHNPGHQNKSKQTLFNKLFKQLKMSSSKHLIDNGLQPEIPLDRNPISPPTGARLTKGKINQEDNEAMALVTSLFVSFNRASNASMEADTQQELRLIAPIPDTKIARYNISYEDDANLSLVPNHSLFIRFNSPYNAFIESNISHEGLFDTAFVSTITDKMITRAKAGNRDTNELDLDWRFLAQRLEDWRSGKEIDINKKNPTDHNNTALHYAIALGGDNIDAILTMLGMGADVKAQNDCGVTPLHTAACYSKKEIVELLISHGAKVNEKDKEDVTPLHIAAYHDEPAIVEILIAKGAELDAQDNIGATPLHVAIYFANIRIAKLLLGNGATKDVKDKEGKTPFDLANSRDKDGSHDKLIALLK